MGKHLLVTNEAQENAIDLKDGRYLIKQEFSDEESAAFDKIAEEWDVRGEHAVTDYVDDKPYFLGEGYAYHLTFSSLYPSYYVIENGTFIGYLIYDSVLAEFDKPETYATKAFFSDKSDTRYSTHQYTLRYRSRNGAVLSEDGKILIAYSRVAEGSAYVPDCVEHIAVGAFANSKISSVNIPKSVKVISSLAFRDCLQLQEVNFEGEKPQISYGAFEHCDIDL